jgi:hypothetical protein
MRIAATSLLFLAGCLDFAALETPPDRGEPADAATAPDIALQGCVDRRDAGEPECDGSTDCTESRACTKIGTLAPLCLYPCGEDADCGCAGAVCLAGACTRLCDPVGNTGCPAGLVCDIAVFAGTVASICRPAGNLAPYSDHCLEGTQSLCPSGYSCLDAQPLGLVCVQLCRLKPTRSSCKMGACQPVNPPYMLGGLEWGACG